MLIVTTPPQLSESSQIYTPWGKAGDKGSRAVLRLPTGEAQFSGTYLRVELSTPELRNGVSVQIISL